MSRISRQDQLTQTSAALAEAITTVQKKIGAPEVAPAGAAYVLITSLKNMWTELRPEAGSITVLRQQLISLSTITTQLLNHHNGTKPLSDKSINSMSDTLKAMVKGGSNNIHTLAETHLGHGDINRIKVINAYKDLRTACAELSPSSELYAGPADRLVP
ncbi:MAG: hypothetical protein P1U40_08640 [Coxiellaceae bacterium]|nr:hypothetical protein [Coxiellaceae bacterium]